MTKKTSFFLSFCFPLLLTSCGQNNDIESAKKIPIDSLYFSCKINDELIELKSPSVLQHLASNTSMILNKSTAGGKDSIIMGRSYICANNNYRVEFGMSRIFLVDTIIFMSPKVNEVLLEKGKYPFQFMSFSNSLQDSLSQKYSSFSLGLDKVVNQYCGFYIKIWDIKKGLYYSSFVSPKKEGNTSDFDYFKNKSSFQISSSTKLDTGIYKNYLNTWFIESSFNCKLYDSESVDRSAILTDGVLKGCF